MTRFSTLPVRVERGLIDGNSGVFFPLPRQLGSIRRAAADRAVRRLMILFISVTSLDGGAVLSGERLYPYIYNRYYKAKTKCTYHAVTPSVRKAPEPRLLYAGKSAASRYAGGLRDSERGDSEQASLSPRLYLDGV